MSGRWALDGTGNWDYRYCWLRDATFTLLAFMHLGYYEEARAWGEWLHRAVAGSPRALTGLDSVVLFRFWRSQTASYGVAFFV
jgi:GH15 family glucan-1,4-alpha-glucosidase